MSNGDDDECSEEEYEEGDGCAHFFAAVFTCQLCRKQFVGFDDEIEAMNNNKPVWCRECKGGG